jgi:diguanylate cyclase (GGDEF)-like protein
VTLLALPRAIHYDVLEGESRRDPLTGLYNRKELFEKLGGEISKAARMRGVVSFLLLDIDHFKNLNDTYGHIFGDEVLITIARIMQNIVRPYDTVARYGGEEFSIILYDIDGTLAKKIADRIRVAVKTKTFERRGKGVKVTVSIGVATYPHDSRTLEDLVDMADKALYHSKGSGRDRVSTVHDLTT